MQTTLDRNSSAEICRQNGWGPGTILEGRMSRFDEGMGRNVEHVHRIQISAVGYRQILAELVSIDGIHLGACDEQPWDLHSRDWEAVG